MKKTLLLTTVFATVSLFAISCSTPQSSQQDYFGYNNNPKIEDGYKSSKPQARQNNWKNPMAENNQQNENYVQTGSGSDNVIYEVNSPMYVPVIVPWWNHYYDWVSYPVGPRVGFGFYWGWDWYSPWYRYHPYYGSYWPGYNGYYHNWWHQPVYSYYHPNAPRRTETVRTFGPGRGTYSGKSLPNINGSSGGGRSNKVNGSSYTTVRSDSPTKLASNLGSRSGLVLPSNQVNSRNTNGINSSSKPSNAIDVRSNRNAVNTNTRSSVIPNKVMPNTRPSVVKPSNNNDAARSNRKFTEPTRSSSWSNPSSRNSAPHNSGASSANSGSGSTGSSSRSHSTGGASVGSSSHSTSGSSHSSGSSSSGSSKSSSGGGRSGKK